MTQIFVDTSGWIALNSKRDQLHGQAVSRNRSLLRDGHRYVTTNFVLDETYTGLRMKVGHFASVDFGEKIRKAQTVHILHVSADIEEAAWDIFRRYSDKEFSFTDCTSFVAMQRLNVTQAFTSDHHFEQIGFTILLQP